MTTCRRPKGFTLIELVIVVVIVGILAMIAFPFYDQFVIRNNRSAAQRYMMDVANRQEQYLSNLRAYTTTLGAGGLAFPAPDELSGRYTFAVVVNEYSRVVGVVTLNDVMSTVMGALVAPHDEEQIVRREDGSFLADGITPIPDVERSLGIESWPHAGTYDTLAGFLMVMLRRIPRRTDVVEWEGWRFEVVDVDSYRVDQVMITAVAPATRPN